MANDVRKRANFVAGQLSSAMLTGDTTIQGAGLADMPVVGSTEHMPLSIFRTDNSGRIIQKEIVWVTAHTAGATSATCTRGREGTTAQAWNVGDRFSVSDVESDNIIICTSTTRPAALYDGQMIWEQDTKRMWVADLTAGLWKDPSGDTAWIAPSLVNGWVNYDGTLYSQAKYRKIGDVVYVSGLVRSGTMPGDVFILPAGYRPSRNLHFATAANGLFAILEICTTVGTPGAVKANTGSNTWFSLECSFPVP